MCLGAIEIGLPIADGNVNLPRVCTAPSVIRTGLKISFKVFVPCGLVFESVRNRAVNVGSCRSLRIPKGLSS